MFQAPGMSDLRAESAWFTFIPRRLPDMSRDMESSNRSNVLWWKTQIMHRDELLR